MSGTSLWCLDRAADSLREVSHNPFLMKHGIDLSNGLCNGFFWGCINRHAEETFLRCWVLEVGCDMVTLEEEEEEEERSSPPKSHPKHLLRKEKVRLGP